MIRYFDEDKRPLKAGEEGPYAFDCLDDKQAWNDTGCPENIIWEGDSPRLRTNQEQVDYLERKELDSMVVLSKLELKRALHALDLWKTEVKPLIKGNEDFEDDWESASAIDTLDSVFQTGLAMTNIDMDTVKRKIIELRNA